MKFENTFAWGRGANLPDNIEYDKEYDTKTTLDGKKVFIKIVKRGNFTSDEIAASGTLASGVNRFLGVEWGVIQRQNGQIHNINAINNLPDQHASIIFQTGNEIQWWFNTNATAELTQFMRKSFIAMIVFTKN